MLLWFKNVCINLLSELSWFYTIWQYDIYLKTHVLQHARLASPSPIPGACSNSCPSSQWHHPMISPSAITFSSFLQSFQTSGSLPTSQFFASGGQSIGVSASAPVLPMNIQYWFPLGLTDLISAVQGTLKSLLQYHNSKALILQCSASFMAHSHIYTWLLEKP